MSSRVVRTVEAVEAVELRRVRMRLVEPFRSSEGVVHDRDLLLIHVLGPNAGGWGECAALPEPTYSPEYTDGAAHVLRHHLIPRLLHAGPEGLAAIVGHPMAKAALRTAVLDAQLRAAGRSLVDYLGATRTEITVGVVVGLPPDHDTAALVEIVKRRLAEGYTRIKLKIEPGYDVEPVAAVRAEFGPDLALWADANGAYSLDDADLLKRLDDFDLGLIEQPLPPDDLLGHAELARRIATPICLDESITSAATAETAIAVGACRVVNIKPGRVGGLDEARRIHDVCAARGIPVWCGGMLETGIGRAANFALACLPNFTLPGDLSASDRYYETDITEPFVLHPGGIVRVPPGPGIGLQPHPDALDEFTIEKETFR